MDDEVIDLEDIDIEDKIELIENMLEDARNDNGEYCTRTIRVEEEEYEAIDAALKKLRLLESKFNTLSSRYLNLCRSMDRKDKKTFYN